MSDKEDEYLKAIEKLAKGYEYEETQTLIEETTSGTKKKVIRFKKHMPPSFQAATYLIKKNNQLKRQNANNDEEIHKSEKVQSFKIEKF